ADRALDICRIRHGNETSGEAARLAPRRGPDAAAVEAGEDRDGRAAAPVSGRGVDRAARGPADALERQAVPRAAGRGCRPDLETDLPDRRGCDRDPRGLLEEVARGAEAGDRNVPKAPAALRL